MLRLFTLGLTLTCALTLTTSVTAATVTNLTAGAITLGADSHKMRRIGGPPDFFNRLGSVRDPADPWLVATGPGDDAEDTSLSVNGDVDTDRPYPSGPSDPGIAELFSSLVPRPAAPDILARSVTAALVRTPPGQTLDDVIKQGIFELDLLGLMASSGPFDPGPLDPGPFDDPGDFDDVPDDVDDVTPVPLPAGLFLLSAGLVGLVLLNRRTLA